MTDSTGSDIGTRRLFQMKDFFPYNLSVTDVPQRALNIRVTNSGYKSLFEASDIAHKSFNGSYKGS